MSAILKEKIIFGFKLVNKLYSLEHFLKENIDMKAK
jgi:hypothetical protein